MKLSIHHENSAVIADISWFLQRTSDRQCRHSRWCTSGDREVSDRSHSDESSTVSFAAPRSRGLDHRLSARRPSPPIENIAGLARIVTSCKSQSYRRRHTSRQTQAARGKTLQGSRYERHWAVCEAPRRSRCPPSIEEGQRGRWPDAAVTHSSPWQDPPGSRYERHWDICKAPRRSRCPPSIEKGQRGRWPDAAVTRRAQGGSGHRLCRSSVTM